MAAINFPSNPAVNDIFTAGNRSWKFNGVAWQLQAKSTDNITEGSTNLYFTEARVASAPAVTALESRASDIESAASSLESRVSTAESSISDLQSDLGAAGSDIDSLENRALDLENRTSTVEGKVSSLESQNLDTRTTDLEAHVLGDAVTSGGLAGLDSRVSTAENNITDVQSSLSNAQSNIDELVADVQAAEGNIYTLQSGVANLESNLETERGRIDAILSASTADKDSFAEIVQLINSVDTENDQAFAGYVTSNNAALQAEVDRATAAEQSLSDSIASLVSGAAASVRDTVLTGLSTATNAAISATDSVLSAFGKLQAQVSAVLSSLNSHVADTSNPHSVTKAQVGLGNVDNTSDADKPVSTAQQAALDLKANAENPRFTGDSIVFNDLVIGDSVFAVSSGELFDYANPGELFVGERTLKALGAPVDDRDAVRKQDLDAVEAAKQIKDTLGTSAPAHEDGRRWIDTTDMTEYVSYNGAWVELDRA